MPRAAPVLCRCGKVRQSNTRCVCQPARVDTRPGSRRRGYDKAWEVAARAFLAEPGNDRCQCGRPAVLVAHRISIRARPDLRMDRRNWRPSCRACNASDTYQEKKHRGVPSPLAERVGNHAPQRQKNSAAFSGLPFAVLGGDEC